MTNGHMCKLEKSLYGFKQAPRAWYGRIDGFLLSLGFTKSKLDSNLYYKFEGDGIIILLLYVDNLGIQYEVEVTPYGCINNLPKWIDRRRSIY